MANGPEMRNGLDSYIQFEHGRGDRWKIAGCNLRREHPLFRPGLICRWCHPLVFTSATQFRLRDGVVHVEKLPAAAVPTADHHATANDVQV